MASFDGQGQSLATERKERGFSILMESNLAVWTRFRERNVWAQAKPYFHFDLYAGSGMNDVAGCIGSPLVFVGMVNKLRVPEYRAHFCENDESRVVELRDRLADMTPRVVVHDGDNMGLIPAIPDLIRPLDNPAKAIGSILLDPNGTLGAEREELLLKLIRQCERLDVLINWNATASKRPGGGRRLPALLELLRPHRKHGLIRGPIAGDPHQFSFIALRNFEAAEHRSEGFYDIDGIKGQDILDTISTTRAEQKARRAVDIFESISDVPGISGSSNLPGHPRGSPAQGQLDLRAMPKKARK